MVGISYLGSIILNFLPNTKEEVISMNVYLRLKEIFEDCYL